MTKNTMALLLATAALITAPLEARALPAETRARLLRSVVAIVALDLEGGGARPIAQGSGTVVSRDGWILTNLHVVRDANGALHRAVAIGFTEQFDRPPAFTCLALPPHGLTSEADDLALIRCEHDLSGGALRERAYSTAPLGDSRRVTPGDDVFVVAYPAIGGGTISVTAGKVAGFFSAGAEPSRSWIKTDATIAGGSSGGAAFDAAGTLIGVPTRIGEIERRAGVPIGQLNLLRPLERAEAIFARARRDLRARIAVPPADGISTPASAEVVAAIPPDGDAPRENEPGGVVVRGLVVDAGTQAPVPAATITVLRPDRPPGGRMAPTDADAHTSCTADRAGRFVCPRPLPRGHRFGLHVVARGYAAQMLDGFITITRHTGAQLDLGVLRLHRAGEGSRTIDGRGP